MTHIDRTDENDSGRGWSGVLVLTVWPGPDGRTVARIRMTTDAGNPGEAVVTTASRAEVLDRVGDFLDSFTGDSDPGTP